MAFGSFSQNDDDTPMAEINVTPLVDVMLVLLIIFMITMPVLTHSIPLQLPIATDEKTDEIKPQKPVRLAISPAGEYFLDDKQVALDELKIVLQQQHTKNPDLVLAIAADKSVAYERVADALQTAQQAGVVKIGFETEVENR
ncbi:MAG: biopolymer transporter ExbD [Neisseriaceae bacterium]|nr:biopolymer transporter ExbD [Neisseriaceae bacterium]